jgi:hypothetical protein
MTVTTVGTISKAHTSARSNCQPMRARYCNRINGSWFGSKFLSLSFVFFPVRKLKMRFPNPHLATRTSVVPELRKTMLICRRRKGGPRISCGEDKDVSEVGGMERRGLDTWSTICCKTHEMVRGVPIDLSVKKE